MMCGLRGLKGYMNILLIAPAFAPVVTAHSERSVAIARLLRNAGHAVQVVSLDTQQGCAAPDYESNNFADDVAIVNTGIHRSIKTDSRFRILRAGMNLIAGFPGPYAFEARRIVSHIRECVDIPSIDLVWVSTPPHELQTVGYQLCQEYGIPFVMDLRDIWTESERIRWPTALHRLVAHRWYLRCLNSAAAIVANTPGHARLLKEHHGSGVVKRLFCLPNGYFEADFPEAVGQATVGSRTILYAGSGYGGKVEEKLGSLQYAASALGSPIRVRYLGANGGRFPFEYVGRVAPTKVAEEVAGADWLFLYMPPNAASLPVMSLKSYVYARSGRPVVYWGPRNETYEFLQRYLCVIPYEDNDEDNVIRQMDAALVSSDKIATDVQQAYSWESKKPLLEQILESVLSTR